MLKLSEFFGHLDTFRYKALFEGVRYPWEVVGRLQGFIRDVLLVLGKGPPQDLRRLPGVTLQQVWDSAGNPVERMLVVQSCIQEAQDIYLEDLGIYIGRHTVVEPGVVIKAPALIGEHSQIRQGAYLRGSVIVGDHCVVGHTTEVKNSVFLDGAEAGHFAYVGDSILGSHVNLGAGTKLANLPFRTPTEKESEVFKPIHLIVKGQSFATGLGKLGAILGDYVEIGCNAVTAPGTLIGRNCWVYPNTMVRKGYYAADLILRPSGKDLELIPKGME